MGHSPGDNRGYIFVVAGKHDPPCELFFAHVKPKLAEKFIREAGGHHAQAREVDN